MRFVCPGWQEGRLRWLGHKDVRGKAGKRDGMVQVRVLRAGAGEGGVDSTPKALGPYCGLDYNSKCYRTLLIGFEFGDIV